MIDSPFNFLNPWQSRLLSMLRLVIGLMLLQHGLSKLFHFPPMEQFAVIKPYSLIWFSGVIELVGGVLLTLGLLTRLTAFIIAGEMAVAYFLVHAPQSFYPLLNGGELAAVYCFALLYIAAAGPGPWSVDAQLSKAA